jgi:predicted GTPase
MTPARVVIAAAAGRGFHNADVVYLGRKDMDVAAFTDVCVVNEVDKGPGIGTLLPAMGYDRKQTDDLCETIAHSDADPVPIGTPIDLRRLIDLDTPALRVTYRQQAQGEPTPAGILAERGPIGAAALA